MYSPARAPQLAAELKRIYESRFSGLESYRDQVWQVLTQTFFSQWVRPEDTVLDLGCGYCEFINNVRARTKLAMDLNPSARIFEASNVRVIEQDCTEPWPIAEHSLDVVFSSNFCEHLPTKAALQITLMEAHRCLKPDGYLIAVGPNIKALGGRYWDFFDHHIELTERSLSELFYVAGYRVEKAIAKFLPYSMSQGFHPPIWSLKVYLRSKILWRIFGRQFLVIARKQTE